MTKEELESYRKLQVKFAADVKRVAAILSVIDEGLAFVNDSQFQLRKTIVYINGTEIDWVFNADMLTWSNEKVQEYVDKIIAKRKEERLKEKAEQMKRELAELARLKKKYESNE